jgi:hypothetical protein
MQSAAVLGIYGLTLTAVLVFAPLPVLWSEARRERRCRARPLRWRWPPQLAAMALLGQGAPDAGGASDRAR